MSWGLGGAQCRDPHITFMYLPRAHIGPKADFGKISFAGPKNRFFTDWANITKRLKNVPRVFFEAILTPIQRGFILSNFGVDLKIFVFLAILAFLRYPPKWPLPPSNTVKARRM